jgi:signal transduction histidine kinase
MSNFEKHNSRKRQSMETRWRHTTLRGRIFILIAALVIITLGGGLVTMWYILRVNSIMHSVIDRGIPGLQAAEELETALAMQKGFLTYYSMTGEAQWLNRLQEYTRKFEGLLKKADELNYAGVAKDVLNQIGSEYANMRHTRDKVIELYQAGDRSAATNLHWDARAQFSAVFELCEKYKKAHEQEIARMRTGFQKQARFMTTMTVAAIPGVVVSSILLAYILLNQVLGPIRQLAKETYPDNADASVDDEVKALERGVYTLMEDVDETKTKLEKSQKHLLQSEKMATTGRLAAGVAHSIRNPLTSVKMRLFSLSRSLDLSMTQREDFDVISEEIGHIDTIVQNFLEFSRPPKLKMQKVSPSDAVDMAIRLLSHRLEMCDVQVELNRETRLPETIADPDQLKEVLVNLMVNASEAMGGGGRIIITEEQAMAEPLGPALVIQVGDNGPGVPKSIRTKIFEPFFSTREEGTGIGLAMARRIVEKHGGWLDLRSNEGEGATFIITLPLKENTT